MNFARLKKDFKYIYLNCFINHIPSWLIRRALYRNLGMKIANTARIGIKTIVDEPKNIIIGERTVINEYCHLDGRGGLTIGHDTSISIYSKIISASHHKDSGSFEYYCGSVTIGNRVWIGCGAIILNHSIIEDNAIVGAGSVFKGHADKDGIYFGNPCTKRDVDRQLENEYELNFKPYFR